MGFLAPLLLLAAAVVAVPLILHLFHRHQARRVVFPALRYILRTEKEHARRIRLRQLLLLLARVTLVLLLALAAARLFVRGGGDAHPPTALVLVLDNSLSSSRVVGGGRVLDELAALALVSLESATAEDRVWVVRAGEPWELAVPGTPREARELIRATEPSHARGDLADALRRAATLARSADLPAAEIHLLSDLQASAFDDEGPAVTGIPVVAWAGVPEAGSNRYLRDARAGGGLPPLAQRRTDVTLGLGGMPGDTAPVPVRLVLEGRVRGAATVRPGGAAVLPVGPFPVGAVTGWAEADPDDLSADDRRYLAFEVHPPPTVAVAGDPGPFVTEALAVLEEAGRVRRDPAAPPDLLLATGGSGLGAASVTRAVVIPPADPTLLPALNRRLNDAGVPWRYGQATEAGEARVAENALPVDLGGVRVISRYALLPDEAAPDAGQGVLARLTDGGAWIVGGEGPAGSWLLLGSPLVLEASTLPVDAAMVPLLEWAFSGWGSGAAPGPRTGEPLPLPPTATHVMLPDGTRVPADGTRQLRATRTVGIYTVMAGDSVLERTAVNAPVRESLLEPLPRDRLAARVSDETVVVTRREDWSRETFTNRQGHELWRPLLLAVVALMLLESWMAASGGRGSPGRSPPTMDLAPDA